MRISVGISDVCSSDLKSATAYVMFTSGSTGQPKGVAVPHRAIARLVCNTNFATFGPDTRSAVYSNPSFDASTLEIWAPLLNGGTAVVVERRAMLDMATLRRILAESNITLLWVTAGLFQEIAGIDPSVFAGERLVMTGGDTVSPDAARAVLAAGAASGLRLLDGYGPTENTTFSTTFDIAGLDRHSLSVPIGRTIANSAAYVLDRCGQVLPVGVTGESYDGGDCVANGHFGSPETHDTAVLPDAFSGPTENTPSSTTFDIAGLDRHSLSVPIGRPIANSAAYVLDRCGQVLPVGVTGEIYVGGDGVANGYVGSPERTATAFLPDPFSGRANARMYRTGDHGRWRADGAILFAGRFDDQVKVRGFRIELNEIAAALSRHPALRAVHVARSEEHTSALQSLMRISYAVFCLQNK